MPTTKPKIKSQNRKSTKTKNILKNKLDKTEKPVDLHVNLGLTPITPEFEAKLNKSFDNLERYFKAGAYSGPIASMYLLYQTIKSSGDIFLLISFVGITLISIGMAITFRLFSHQSKQAIPVFGVTLVLSILVTILLKMLKGGSPFGLEIIGFVIVISFFIEMFRLKKYNLLY